MWSTKQWVGLVSLGLTILGCLGGLARVAGAAPAYPLTVSPTGRYLVDHAGTPFLLVGDSPQALLVNLTEAQAATYFADRAARGFNTVWINLLCAAYTGGRADGSLLDGTVPFTTPGDLASPNEAYFAHVDRVLALAAQAGLLVLLDPAETGGWLDVLRANGTTKARAYGRYLGTRYQHFTNLLWMSGNDFQSWRTPGDDAVVQAVARGIHDTAPGHLQTVELDYNVSTSLDDPSWAPLIQLNAAYTYYPTYAEVLHGYTHTPAVPVFMVEANYEFENNTGMDYGSPALLRRQEYWTLLSGATGQLYGNHYTWQFLANWSGELNTPGTQQFQLATALFTALPWSALVPDQTHAVVTAGYGSFATTGSVGGNDYAPAARTPDGTLVLVYLPTSRTLTVNLAALTGAVTARWFDPTTGGYTAIPGPLNGTFPHTGVQRFTPPGTNAAGDGDWVLVLATGLTVSSVTPPTGPIAGGTLVTLTGTNFVAGTVTFGGTPATRAYQPPSTAATPAHAAARWPTVSNPGGRTLPAGFTYTATSAISFVQGAAATPQAPTQTVTVAYPRTDGRGPESRRGRLE